ncbi:hypothetical protein RB628_01070 [Streptomyces sp. ADMS]|uniref:hypothetical protein n=1 Tax=Streptomyces sp. ADMS TaxID=3071415 RepID=UPI00296F1DB0|nr:hypothetical protein [Streptomyces sp. ADMS]MDW4903969.1 hypothetical protein [Streptomyces sp. ADMS]
MPSRSSPWSRDRFTEFIIGHHSGRHTLHGTQRRLMAAVVDQHADKLDDDATVLLSEWCGGHQENRTP